MLGSIGVGAGVRVVSSLGSESWVQDSAESNNRMVKANIPRVGVVVVLKEEPLAASDVWHSLKRPTPYVCCKGARKRALTPKAIRRDSDKGIREVRSLQRGEYTTAETQGSGTMLWGTSALGLVPKARDPRGRPWPESVRGGLLGISGKIEDGLVRRHRHPVQDPIWGQERQFWVTVGS